MGYRHYVISDSSAPVKDRLPDWFVEKWGRFLNLEKSPWHSWHELKRYTTLADLDEDVQKLVREHKDLFAIEEVQLVYFADEGGDVIHTHITSDKISERDLPRVF